MLSLRDEASMKAALRLRLQPELRQMLSDRIQDAAATELLNMTHFVVVEPGDCEHDLVDAIGLTPLVNPIDRARYGARDFHPFWDFLEHHSGWFEMIVSVGNSGFAFVLFIQDAEGADSELMALCREYAQ